MSPALANFLFEAANFLLLAAVLGWVLFKPVRRALEGERKRHEEEQKESSRLRAEAEAAVDEARRARKDKQGEIEEARKEILGRAQKEAEELLEKARATQRTERQALERELDERRHAEASELAEDVGKLAAEAVRTLLETLDGPSLDLALVRAARKELEGIPKESRSPAQVESARGLSPEAKALLETVLGPGFQARVVTGLGAGVRVTTPVGQVDATAASVARHAGVAVRRLGDQPEAGQSPGGPGE